MFRSYSGLLLLVLGSAATAAAVPVTFTETSTVSGTIGAQTFSNVLVKVTTVGNTNDVIPRAFDPGDGSTYTTYFDSNVTTTVAIPGIGIATVTMPTGILAFPTPIIIDKSFPATEYIIIARLDEVFPGDITGIAALGGSSLAGYTLQSSIGPITSIGGVGYPSGDPLSTTLGNLSFTSNIVSTMSGTFTAIAVTPEPSTLLLLGSSLVAVTLRSRRQR